MKFRKLDTPYQSRAAAWSEHNASHVKYLQVANPARSFCQPISGRRFFRGFVMSLEKVRNEIVGRQQLLFSRDAQKMDPNLRKEIERSLCFLAELELQLVIGKC